MSDNNESDINKEKAQFKKNSVSVIYHQKNDSPKYFEIKKSKLYLFLIGLPTLTFVAIILGVLGLVNSSPFHVVDNFRQNSLVRKEAREKETLLEENEKLKFEKETLEETLKTQQAVAPSAPISDASGKLCPAPTICPPTTAVGAGTISSIGLSTLSLFKPIQGQKDKTRPAVLNLSGFKTVVGRDTLNLQFNIIPTTLDDEKVSGHIIVLMKNEVAIQAYPIQALGSNDFQINYASGETFATQRFRPVDANFIKPRKSGFYSFTVFIFARNGDLIHFHTVSLPVQL
ncbi:MAG: hypothetical protein HOP07_05975 [Bacteriovoracaceae bacterium]|nr:hypothetical protein [Bacteriovoracaceae bacterium]